MRFFSAFFLTLGVCFHSSATDWTWEGFEIIGQRRISKAEIQSHIPIQLGSIFTVNKPLWDQWCASIKSTYHFYYVECSSVRYVDFKAYLTVEIVEKGDEFRLKFNKEPTQSIPLADQEVVSTFDSLQERMWELFEQGDPVGEHASNGYLDYGDPAMSKMAHTLIRLTPKFRKNLLTVLEFDRDPNQRAKAATLLNWALNTEDSISKVHRFLGDPSGLVRNNVSRFMLHYFDRVLSSQTVRNVILNLSQQIWFPTHGDRNKAIYGLLAIAQSHPHERDFIKQTAINGIEFLSKNSILNNVQVPAQQLLELLNETNTLKGVSLPGNNKTKVSKNEPPLERS